MRSCGARVQVDLLAAQVRIVRQRAAVRIARLRAFLLAWPDWEPDDFESILLPSSGGEIWDKRR